MNEQFFFAVRSAQKSASGVKKKEELDAVHETKGHERKKTTEK